MDYEKLKEVLSPEGLATALQVVDLQELLMSVEPDNVEEIVCVISNSFFLKNEELVCKLALNIYVGCKYRLHRIDEYAFLAFLLCKNNSNPENLILEFKQRLFTIDQAFVAKPWCLCFMYKCIKLFDKNEIYKYIESFLKKYSVLGDCDINIFCFFAQYVEEKDKKMFEQIKNKMVERRKSMHLGRIFHLFIDEFDTLRENNWELLNDVIQNSFLSKTIFCAILHDDVESLEEFTKAEDFDPNMKVPEVIYSKCNLLFHRCTLLEFAAFYGAQKCFDHLEKIGADPRITDDIGLNLMQFSVAGGHRDMIVRSQKLCFDFVEDGAVPIVAEYYRYDLFYWLCRTFNVDIERSFLQTGTIFHRCASANNIYLMLHCIEKGVNVNVFDNLDLTPLFYAAKNGSTDAIDLLLAHKDINWALSDKFKDTPLHSAATYGEFNAYKALMKHKDANINVEDFNGRPSIVYAVYYGFPEIVKYIVDHPDVQLNKIDTFKTVPIFHCCMTGEHVTFEMVLNVPGININIPREGGETTLHYSVRNNFIKIVELLMKHEETDPNVKTSDGICPLHIAVTYGYEEITRLFMGNKKTDVNILNGYGYTPLHLAVKYVHLNIVKALMESDRIDPNCPNTVLFILLLFFLEFFGFLIMVFFIIYSYSLRICKSNWIL